MIDFQTVRLTKKPNQFLVAPEGLCTLAEPHRTAPVYDVSAQDLRAAWDGLIAKQPRIEEIDADEGTLKFEIVQRTFFFRYPDTITVQFIDLPETGKSTLAIYSRSQIGYSDFDVNKKRISKWLNMLADSLPIAA